jgi:elongation factor G
VEAQTCTVWSQAERHQVPRIVYVNKMDRADADLLMCISSLKSRLGVTPLLLQMPVKESGSKGLPGIIDLVTEEHLYWEKSSASKNMHRLALANDNHLAEKVKIERSQLVEQLADLDDELAEIVIHKESAHKITSHELQVALRRVTLKQVTTDLHNCYN